MNMFEECASWSHDELIARIKVFELKTVVDITHPIVHSCWMAYCNACNEAMGDEPELLKDHTVLEVLEAFVHSLNFIAKTQK